MIEDHAGEPAPGGQPSAKLRRALERVLRPLVRLMLSQNLPIQEASSLLKQVYFDVANEELERSQRKRSDSRLSLMTGIHRKELKRLREHSDSAIAEPPRSISLGAQLIARWTGDQRYLDAEGRPRPLIRATVADAEADEPSFDDLVKSVSRDIHPRSVLDEWIRLGLVRVDDARRIHLLTAAFVPRQGFDEKLFYLGRNGHDHLDAAVRNIQGSESPLLERSVHYNSLAPDDVNALARFAEQEGMKLLEKLNEMARERSSEPHDDEKAERMNFGLYFYRGPRNPSEAERSGAADAPLAEEGHADEE